jgi:hypothetical protein
MSDGTIIYKGYEIFPDPAYFHKIAVRAEGEKSFDRTLHVDTVDQAKKWVDRELLMPHFRYDMRTGERITEYKCSECGKPSGGNMVCNPCVTAMYRRVLSMGYL